MINEQEREHISREEAYKRFVENYHHGRDRHKKKYLEGGERVGKTVGQDALRYQIELNDLEDDDIRKICDIYWMDYICIPFPMPKQCNLTELLLRHYGDDIVYKDCWEYETKEWDETFKNRYQNGSISRRGKDRFKNGKPVMPGKGGMFGKAQRFMDKKVDEFGRVVDRHQRNPMSGGSQLRMPMKQRMVHRGIPNQRKIVKKGPPPREYPKRIEHG